MKQAEVMNHYVSALIMGIETFKIYEEKAESEELRDIIQDFLTSFENQLDSLKKSLNEIGFKPEEECSILQKNALRMESVKTYMVKSDFELCIQMIKAMNSALVGSLKYYQKMDNNIKRKFKQVIKRISVNYENIIGKIKNYVLDN